MTESVESGHFRLLERDGTVLFESDAAPGSEAWALPAIERKESAPVECVSSRGFIANRSEIAASLGLAAASPDSELAVSLYQKWGAQAAERVAGPFSFVLADRSQGRLVAVADRAGLIGCITPSATALLLLATKSRRCSILCREVGS